MHIRIKYLTRNKNKAGEALKLATFSVVKLLVLLFCYANSFSLVYAQELKITSKVDGVILTVNEQVITTLPLNKTYTYHIESNRGTAGWGEHNIVLQKDVGETQEL